MTFTVTTKQKPITDTQKIMRKESKNNTTKSHQITREESKRKRKEQRKNKRVRRGEGEDGGRVRRGDHLPSHRYSRNTSTRGTPPTEHPLNAGRKRPTSKKARNSPVLG